MFSTSPMASSTKHRRAPWVTPARHVHRCSVVSSRRRLISFLLNNRVSDTEVRKRICQRDDHQRHSQQTELVVSIILPARSSAPAEADDDHRNGHKPLRAADECFHVKLAYQYAALLIEAMNTVRKTILISNQTLHSRMYSGRTRRVLSFHFFSACRFRRASAR